MAKKAQRINWSWLFPGKHWRWRWLFTGKHWRWLRWLIGDPYVVLFVIILFAGSWAELGDYGQSDYALVAIGGITGVGSSNIGQCYSHSPAGPIQTSKYIVKAFRCESVKSYPVQWSGQLKNTNDHELAIKETLTQLASAYHDHPGRKIILMAHSDGAAIALKALERSTITNIRFVTMGTLLSSPANGLGDACAAVNTLPNPSDTPKNVDAWINIYSECDPLSRPLGNRTRPG